MNKRWIGAAAGVVLALGSFTTVWGETEESLPKAQTEAEEESLPKAQGDWTWQEISGNWKYGNAAGEYKTDCWEEIGGYWYHFDKDGVMATDWIRVKGVNYSFSETGELELGWRYNEEEEAWHYFDEDGIGKTGWFQDKDGSWYWFSAKGKMADSGYKAISGKRYYFYDNGQMAANQYIGLSYVDDNGQRDKTHDIVIDSRGTGSITAEQKDLLTESVKNIPRGWMKEFIRQGWEIIYYPNRQYFSAPLTGGGAYYVYHKLDTHYKKIKICSPEALTEAFGEYIGYASGCYDDDSQEGIDLMMGRDEVEEFVDIPSYYEDDLEFYFGKLVSAYVDGHVTRGEMEEAAPDITGILKKILYSKV